MNFEKSTIARTGITAVIGAMIFVTAITIASDLYLPIKDWLKATHGHHWVGKGIWTVILFVFFAVVSYPLHTRNVCNLSARAVKLSAHFAIFATVAITLFFVYEYTKH